MRKIFLVLVAIGFGVGIADAGEFEWTFILRPPDMVAGAEPAKAAGAPPLAMGIRRQGGKFEIAVRKSAFPAAAPQCHMDYLILGMPLYYPENPKQAPLSERRAVYDALLAMQASGKGALSAHVEPLQYARTGSVPARS